jgi:hypothetical protein
VSYDLQIWSIEPVNPAQSFPAAHDWQQSDRVWTRTSRDWELSVFSPDRVLAEDVPDAVTRALPGIAFLTHVSLSPIGAPSSAVALLARVANRLAAAAHGVIVDPQADTMTTPKGVARIESLGPAENASLIVMSWWFASGPLVIRDATSLVTALEVVLPEALPRRYGAYEPPQHRYDEAGRDHFISFVRHGDQRGVLVWYPHSPVADVSLSIPDRVGGSPRGFRAGHLSISVDVDALRQPGWILALERAWRRLSHVVEPYYGDVRKLSGFHRRRGRYLYTRETERHPVVSWWWPGIPPGPICAAVVGDPYRQLWPAFADQTDVEGNLCFLTNGDWSTDTDPLSTIGAAPQDIVQQPRTSVLSATPDAYPPTWPFESPRTTIRPPNPPQGAI